MSPEIKSKYVATLNREFGDIPEVICFPQQLNQVFHTLLVNAGHATEETQGQHLHPYRV
jgi:signal transduction histidine kinase